MHKFRLIFALTVFFFYMGEYTSIIIYLYLFVVLSFLLYSNFLWEQTISLITISRAMVTIIPIVKKSLNLAIN